MEQAINNPLYGIQVGSTVNGETGKYAAPVLKPGATTFNGQQSGNMSMTGSSDYLYSDYMNQGSLGIAGGYGVSGIGKFSGTVSAYVGNSHAKGKKSLSITLNDIKWAGVEYVDFDDLGVGEFIACLKSNVQHHVEDALDKYLEMESQFEGKSPREILAALKEDNECFDAWQESVQRFFQRYGTGLVVGVLWGGWGAVTLEFTSSNEEDRWKGGGAAEFTYAGAAASVDIAATYGHSQSSLGEGAGAKVSAYYNGACVEKLVNAWFSDLQQKATAGLSEIGKASVTRNASLGDSIVSPKIPERSKPKSDPKVADKIGKIKSLDSLDAYAKAAAYDKYKEGGGDKDLNEFLKEAAKKSNVADSVLRGPISPFEHEDEAGTDSDDEDSAEGRRLSPIIRLKQEHEPEDDNKGYDLKDFEPMGIWIANWSQLFPWICSAYSNDIPANSQARKLIKLKTMQQDFITLAKLYMRFAVNGISGSGLDFRKISDSFSHGASSISDYWQQHAAGSVRSSSVDVFIKETIAHLSESARGIYEAWDKNGLLRGCELGLGVVIRNKDPDLHTDLSKATISQSGGPAYLGRSQQNNTPRCMATEFSETERNFDEFSVAVKGLPLILPNGTILLYLNFDDTKDCGILSMGDYPHLLEVTKTADGIKFYADGTGGKLNHWMAWNNPRGPLTERSIDLYPIPYEAARGVEKWLGCSLATGMGPLVEQLDAIRETCFDQKKWSFDSDYWKGQFWSDDAYSLQALGLSYVGLTSEPKNILPDK